MEDCSVTKDDLIEQFGPQVALHLVQLGQAVDQVFTTREENQADRGVHQAGFNASIAARPRP